MVGHESVDPKPQAKADQVTGVMLKFLFFLFLIFGKKKKFNFSTQRDATLVKAKGNPVLIPEPGCGYVRDKRPQPSLSRSR